MNKTLYMKVSEKDISKYVVFSGDPFRIDKFTQFLDRPKKIAFEREFNTVTGFYKGVKVTVTSTGIGSPSAAIAMEEMYEAGMEVAIRMGTVMGLKDHLLGQFIIPRASMRREQTTATYVETAYPAVADIELLDTMRESAMSHGYQVDHGINCTMDGFYSQMRESKLSKARDINIMETFKELKSLNVSGIDMESSTILTLGSLMNIKACVVSMTTVLENLKEVLEGDKRTQAEVDLCKVVLDGIVMLDQKEAQNEK